MKFKDIKPFTTEGNYSVDVPLRDLLETINDWVNDDLYKLQLNPDFQRGHVWNEDQQIAYVEYTLRQGRSCRTIYFNMPSWFGSSTIDGYDDFVCVDGLQRLTALMLFLDNKIKAFGHYLNEFEDKIPLKIDININVNNLKTKKEVLQWYIDLNEGGTPHTESEINRVKDMIKML